ncbi:MAG: hypothetical protein EXS05_02445 [Planctomycetaceae bacterium]|nr:hypothetical protein [Planctomycetaceae bacterium]
MSGHIHRALAGSVLLLPACTLVVSGLLGRNPPPDLVHPLVLLVGLAAALMLNIAAVVSAKGRWKDGSLLGGIAIQFEGRLLNLAIIAIALLLVGTIALYLVVENFAPR